MSMVHTGWRWKTYSKILPDSPGLLSSLFTTERSLWETASYPAVLPYRSRFKPEKSRLGSFAAWVRRGRAPHGRWWQEGWRSVALPRASPPLALLRSVPPGVRCRVGCCTQPVLCGQLPLPGAARHRLARQTAERAAARPEAWLESTVRGVECGTGTSPAEQEAFAPPLLPEREMKANWTTDAFSTVLMGLSDLLKREFFPITLCFLSLICPLLFTFQTKSLFSSNILIKKML